MNRTVIIFAICFLSAYLPAAVNVDLVSNANCKDNSRHLVHCKFPKQEFAESGRKSTFVPLKTTIRTIVRGDCENQYGLEAKVVPLKDPASAIAASAVRPGLAVLREKNRGSIGKFLVVDESEWTGMAILDRSCRSHLEITPDEADVESEADAEEILEKLATELRDTYDSKAAAADLMSYRSAYHLFHRLSELLDQELSQRLQAELSLDSVKTLETLQRMRASGRFALTEADRASLEKLEDFVALLPQPGEKRVNVADYFAAEDRAFIDKLTQRPYDPTKMAASLRRLTAKHLRLCQEWTTAVLLLKDYLSSKYLERFSEDAEGCGFNAW